MSHMPALLNLKIDWTYNSCLRRTMAVNKLICRGFRQLPTDISQCYVNEH